MTTPTTMQERFDERFPHKIAEVVDDFGSSVKQDFRAFIQSEINLAVEKREKEIVEMIDRVYLEIFDRQINEQGLNFIKTLVDETKRIIKSIITKNDYTKGKNN